MTSPDLGPRPGIGRSPAALGLAVLAALWTAACIRFLLFPPGHDFLGDMYWVDVLSPHVWRGHLPAWNPGVAMGHPLLFQRMNLMLLLPAIALKAVMGDTETAARMYLVLAHTLSGAAFYALARLYVRRRAVAAFTSLLYLVAPLHVAELTLYGHWALAQSFALSPLVLALVVLTVRERGRAGLRFGLALAAAAAWLAWADNERTATLLPPSWRSRPTRCASRPPVRGRRQRGGWVPPRCSRPASPPASCSRGSWIATSSRFSRPRIRVRRPSSSGIPC